MCRVDLLIGKYLKKNIQTNKYPTNQEKNKHFFGNKNNLLLIWIVSALERMLKYSSQVLWDVFPSTRNQERFAP